tara:strand:- start:235 stop:474 length:240 start_codon:yes stop_codon:yes gene_type:complete
MSKGRRKTQKTKALFKKEQLKDDSPRIVSWFPVTQEQRDQFIRLTINGGWAGITLLVLLWIIVRIIGPAAGWWIPADIK